jgi:hypothetical protein
MDTRGPGPGRRLFIPYAGHGRALVEPRPDHPLLGQVRYVGRSHKLKTRRADHRQPGQRRKRSPRARWINELLAVGQVRESCVLLIAAPEVLDDFEIRAIATYRKRGAADLNTTNGGERPPLDASRDGGKANAR